MLQRFATIFHLTLKLVVLNLAGKLIFFKKGPITAPVFLLPCQMRDAIFKEHFGKSYEIYDSTAGRRFLLDAPI